MKTASAIVTISSKRQFSIPVAIRRALRIDKGDKVGVRLVGEARLAVIPLKRRPRRSSE